LPHVLTHHEVAAISIAGTMVDVLGALYLAYDILGGKHGPLRTLTRGVTYAVLFGTGYGVVLGLPFGIAAGIAHGITLAFELTRASKGLGRYPRSLEFLFSAVRGAGFGIGASFIHGSEFGLVFGVISTFGQFVAYQFGIRPSLDYEARRARRLTRMQMLAAVNRSVGYLIAGYVSAAVAHHQMHALMFGIEAGLTIGLATAAFNFVAPFIEWAAEAIPDRRMGVLGIVLILIGFSLQSVQYWLALLDVPVY
jgi:hypothetical protein